MLLAPQPIPQVIDGCCRQAFDMLCELRRGRVHKVVKEVKLEGTDILMHQMLRSPHRSPEKWNQAVAKL